MYGDKPILYDPLKVSVIIDGRYITNIAKDGITLVKSADNIFPNVGLYGDVGIAISTDHTGELTIALHHGSPSYLHMRDLAMRNAMFSVSIVDNNDEGKVVIHNEYCMVRKTPDFQRNTEVANASFVIFVPYIEFKGAA